MAFICQKSLDLNFLYIYAACTMCQQKIYLFWNFYWPEKMLINRSLPAYICFDWIFFKKNAKSSPKHNKNSFRFCILHFHWSSSFMHWNVRDLGAQFRTHILRYRWKHNVRDLGVQFRTHIPRYRWKHSALHIKTGLQQKYINLETKKA